MTDIAPYPFYIRQKPELYPQLHDTVCRISDIRVIRFLDIQSTMLVLYRVAREATPGVWESVRPTRRADRGWFAFNTKTVIPNDQAIFESAHRHFLSSLQVSTRDQTTADYLRYYKPSPVSARALQARDGKALEYWDPMLIHAVSFGDSQTLMANFGTVKYRQRWELGLKSPGIPYRQGVVYNFKVPPTEMLATRDLFERKLRVANVWEVGRSLQDATLDTYHTIAPEAVIESTPD